VKRTAAALLAVLAGCSSPSSGAAPDPSLLQPVHEAVFDVYLPADSLPLDEVTKQAASLVCRQSWEQFQRDPGMRTLLWTLEHRTGEPAFSARPREARAALLLGLHHSESNDQRRLAQQLRVTYLSTIYGAPLGPALAGIRVPPVEHPALEDYLRSKTPVFPVGRVIYDPDRHELRPREGTFDYAIVGSGPAGSALAFQLRAKGKSVILLEAGPFVLPGALETRAVPRLMESSGRRTSSDGGLFVRTGRTVGGGTAVNVDLAFAPTLPLIRARIEEWRAQGRIGKDDFTPDEVDRAYAWVKEKIGTRVVPEGEINENNRILWDGAAGLGLHPKLYDLNTFAPGSAPSPVTDKRSSVSGLLLEAMQNETNPLALVPDATVRRVRIDERGAHGVEFIPEPAWKGPGVIADPLKLALPPFQPVRVEAKRIVLCAGALGSPVLLLRSGLKNPNIGRGVVAHPSMPVIGRFDRPINVLEGTPASVYVDDYGPDRGLIFESMSEEPQYGAIMIPGSGAEVFEAVTAFSRLGGFGVMLLDPPRDENRVRLTQEGEPEIVYSLGEADRRRLAFGVAEAVRILFQAGAKRVWVPTQQTFTTPSGAPLGRSFFVDASEAELIEQQMAFRPNQCMISSSHLQATNKMSATPETGVVSPGFRVWGTENLFVVDSSVFPTSIGANPMQSLYALGTIAADRLEP